MDTLLIIAIYITQLLPLSYSQINFNCDTPYSCSNRTTTATDMNLRFNAYKAAYGIHTVIQTAGTPNITRESLHCAGIFSCGFASLIHAKPGTPAWPYCDALYSCAYVSQIIASSHFICAGPRSCMHSVISATVLDVYGEQSCRECVITNTSTIEAAAPYTLYKSNISSSVDGLTMNLYGDHAGFGADVHCQDGHTCNVWCYGRRSCEMLYVHGLGQININTPSADTISPIVDQIDYDESKIDADIWTESRFLIAEQQCNDYPTYTFDDSYEHTMADTISDALPVCCRADHACRQNDIDINYVNASAEVPVICGGQSSCVTNHNKPHHITNTQGPIYCDGRDACNYVELNTMDTLICGHTACGSSIINARIVHCISENSCANAVINSVGDLDLYLSGWVSGSSASITCNDGDQCTVYCRGVNSCADITTFQCIGTCTVYCDNDSGCPPGYTPQTPLPTSPTEATTTTLIPTQPPSTVTSVPSSTPSAAPTTSRPSSAPTLIPSTAPSLIPSSVPTSNTSATPTFNDDPTKDPTTAPTNDPTTSHTNDPTTAPTNDPTRSPTNDPTKTPTKIPTSNPTPENAVTKNYEIKIDINNCEVIDNTDCDIAPNDLNAVIESTLSIDANVEIISWAIVDEELIIHLSVTTGPDNVLTPGVISNHIEAKVKEIDDFGEVETEEKDDGFNDIAADDMDDRQNTKYLFNIMTIAASVCAFIGICVLCYCLYRNNALKTQVDMKMIKMTSMSSDGGLSSNDDNTKGDIDTNGNDIDTKGNDIDTKGNDIDTKDNEEGDMDDMHAKVAGNTEDTEDEQDVEDMYEDMYDDIVEGGTHGETAGGGDRSKTVELMNSAENNRFYNEKGQTVRTGGVSIDKKDIYYHGAADT